MKLVIKDKPYFICEDCGSFKSTERCYNCRPIQPGDLDVVPELRQYYNIPAKPSTALGVNTSDITSDKISNGFEGIPQKNPRLKPSSRSQDPEAIILHHLMEYYFTKEQLKEMGLYKDVPEWQLLKVKAKNHHKRIDDYKLHLYKYSKDWVNYKTITEAQIRKMIDNIPKKLIELYGEE